MRGASPSLNDLEILRISSCLRFSAALNRVFHESSSLELSPIVSVVNDTVFPLAKWFHI